MSVHCRVNLEASPRAVLLTRKLSIKIEFNFMARTGEASSCNRRQRDFRRRMPIMIARVQTMYRRVCQIIRDVRSIRSV